MSCWDDYDSADSWTESAYDSGWWTPDDIDELRDIIKLVDITKPSPGDRAMAALILLNYRLSNVATDPVTPEDLHVTWARRLLKVNS